MPQPWSRLYLLPGEVRAQPGPPGGNCSGVHPGSGAPMGRWGWVGDRSS